MSCNNYNQLSNHYANRQYCMSSWRFKLIQFDYVEIFDLLKKKNIYFMLNWRLKLTSQIDVLSWQFQNFLIKMISTSAKFSKFNTFSRFDQSCALSFLHIHFSHFVVRKFIFHLFSLYYRSFYVYQNHSCVIASYYFSIIQSQCRLLIEILD